MSRSRTFRILLSHNSSPKSRLIQNFSSSFLRIIELDMLLTDSEAYSFEFRRLYKWKAGRISICRWSVLTFLLSLVEKTWVFVPRMKNSFPYRFLTTAWSHTISTRPRYLVIFLQLNQRPILMPLKLDNVLIMIERNPKIAGFFSFLYSISYAFYFVFKGGSGSEFWFYETGDFFWAYPEGTGFLA